jgi:hypothetical protein
MEVADRVALELLLGRLIAFDLRQPADAMAHEAAMQSRGSENDPVKHFPKRRPRQVRQGRLQP